jgi:hypothetical protein
MHRTHQHHQHQEHPGHGRGRFAGRGPRGEFGPLVMSLVGAARAASHADQATQDAVQTVLQQARREVYTLLAAQQPVAADQEA